MMAAGVIEWLTLEDVNNMPVEVLADCVSGSCLLINDGRIVGTENEPTVGDR